MQTVSCFEAAFPVLLLSDYLPCDGKAG